MLGNVDLIEGMVRRFKRELNSSDCKVIGTGGQAPLIAAESRVFDHVNLDLTLVGLQIIYEMNNDQHGQEEPQ